MNDNKNLNLNPLLSNKYNDQSILRSKSVTPNNKRHINTDISTHHHKQNSINDGISISQTGLIKKVDREKSPTYFQKSKTDTCPYIKIENGHAVAMPYYIPKLESPLYNH